MGVYEGGGQLNKALKQLLGKWEETKMSWNDAATKEFGDRYIAPLEADVKATLSAMAQMSTLLDIIRRDCT